MHEPIESILADLYELDPSLKERDAETRALVLALIAAQPHITIDDTFAKSLRDQLTRTHLHPYHAEHHSIRWWFLHLAPIGAIAVLTLTLMPNFLRNTQVTHIAIDTPSEAPELYAVPTQKESALDASRTAHRDVDETADTSLMTLSQALPEHDTIVVLTQSPGTMVLIDSVTLTASGFLVVKEGTTNRTIGSSALLSVGTTTSLPIVLTESLVVGGSYFTVLVLDENGNGELDSTDTPVFDPYTDVGLPVEDRILTVPFDVLSPL